MSDKRVSRVASVVRNEISAILRNLKDPRVKFVTVTGVDLSADLKHAKVYVSVLGSGSEREETLAGLDSATGFIRRELGARLKMRNTPELAFRYDDSIEHGLRIDQLLNTIG